MSDINFFSWLLPGRTLCFSQIISPLLGSFSCRSRYVLPKDAETQGAGRNNNQFQRLLRKNTTYLFAFFSIMRVTDMFDFQIGNTKSWVRLSRW
jgi:hypothetical protein